MPAEDILRARRQQYYKQNDRQQNPIVRTKVVYDQNLQNKQRQHQQRRQIQAKKRNNSLNSSFKKTNSVLNSVYKILDTIAVIEKAITSAIPLAVTGILALVGWAHRGDIADFHTDITDTFTSGEKSSGKTSEKGVKDLLQYEGFDAVAVDREGDGILTIGYGHKGKEVKRGQTITREQAYELFKNDLISREQTVNNLVKVPISQNQFDALVSFVYNCGAGNFAKSRTLKLLNQGDYKGAAQAMRTEYINRGTKHEKGLRARRAKEAAKIELDVDSNNKLITKEVNTQRIPEVSQTGGSIGDVNLKSNVKINETMKSYIQDVEKSGGRFTITSGMDGKHAGTASNKRSHYSGNKIDIAVLGLSDEQIINNIIVPLINDPRTIEIVLEAFPNGSGQRIVDKVKERYPQVKKRCLTNARYLKAEGSNVNTTGAHIDVLIDPSKAKPIYKEQNKTEQKIQNTNQKLKEQDKKDKQKQITKKQNKKPSSLNNVNVTNKQTKQQPQRTINIGQANPLRAKAIQNQNIKKHKL